MRLLREFGFDHLELGRIEAFSDVENRAAHYMGLAIGFRHEGIARGKLLRPDGSRRDAVIAAMLPGDLVRELRPAGDGGPRVTAPTSGGQGGGLP